MCIFALQRIASLILFFSLLPSSHAASDKTVSKDFIVELPTLISLGFEWPIDGDDNRNAGISVQYRKRGEQAWKAGMPLLRLQREQTNSGAFHFTAPNMFGGSIFDLDAGTEYDCRFVLADYDVFQRASQPDSANPTKLYNAADFDLRLRGGSAAVDAGTRLPNINDNFTGRAPDLGAYEAGSPGPHYGPRR